MKKIVGLLLGASTLVAYPAMAQDASPPQSDQAAGDEIGTIVVTAQKREQTLQDVPISVAVLDAAALSEQKISDIAGLAQAVPDLIVSESPFQHYVAIRGLGSGAGSRALEQSVATYVDGVYVGRANQFLNPFFDVERVEVVRGPQGVLFGVNANAGAINITTKKGDGGLHGYASAGYEFENEGYNAEAGVTVPLSSTLGVRLAGKVTRDGGWLHNLVTDTDVPREDQTLGRATLSWRPGGPLTADLSYEYSKSKIDGQVFQSAFIVPGVFAPVETGVIDFNQTTPAGHPNYSNIQQHNVILNASYDLGGPTLSSTSGYSKFDYSQALTPPGTVFFGTVFAQEHFDQYYQELRLVSPAHHFFEYILGASYIYQKDNIPQGLDVDLSFFGARGVTSAIRNAFLQKSNTWAAFGQGTVNFTPALNLAVGVRYTSVSKDVNYIISAASFGDPLVGYTFNPTSAVLNRNFRWMLYVNPAVPTTIHPTLINRSRTFDAFNPSVTLHYTIDTQFSAYASFTTGTKAGGFNDQEKSGLVPENGYSPDVFAFDSEKATNYEVGVKYAGHRARFDAAVYYTQYKNLQVSQAIANGVVTTNAGSAHAYGVEMDGQVVVVPRFTINADFALINAAYDDFPGVGCIPSLVPTGCNPLTTNAKGGKLTGVPQIAANFGANYEIPVGSDLAVRLNGHAHYQDKAQWSPNQDPKTVSPDYWSLDAGISLGQINRGWSISLTGKNLTNQIIEGYRLPGTTPVLGYQILVNPGRQIFLDVGYKF